jgi:hypothetical protein
MGYFFLRISVSPEAGSRQQIFVAMEKIITNVGRILTYNHHQKCLETAFPPDGPGGIATLALSRASL